MIKKILENEFLRNFLLWCSLGLLCCFVGIINVNADTYYMNYEYYQQYYDNSGSSVTSVNTTWNESLQSYVSSNITTVVNSYGAGLSISSPIPLLANHTYSMSIYFDGLSNIALSSKNNISIGNSLSNASSNYVNGNYLTTMNYSSVSNNTVLQFAFTTSSNGTFIFIPWSTTSTVSQSYVLTQISIDDLGSGGISQADIDNSLNSQTNVIQNSINNVENNIIENQNNIFTCSNLWNPETQILYEDSHWVYQTINIPKDGTYYFKSNLPNILFDSYVYSVPHSMYLTAGSYLIYFGDNNNVIDVNNAKIMLSATDVPYCKYGQNKIDETNDKLDNIDETLNNSDTSGAQDSGGGFFNDFTTDTHGLTGIITAPLSLIKSITSSSCSPLVIPLPYVDKDLTLPCMGEIYSNYFGSFLSIYQLITFGIVAYWVCVRTFNLVKDFKNPDHDEIEVLDL